MIRIEPETDRRPATTAAFGIADSAWVLDVSEYADFIEAATGITVTETLDPSDCYRVGNRLEGLIDERRRHGTWDADLLSEYPEVESLAEIVSLARFFRQCHDCCLDDAS